MPYIKNANKVFIVIALAGCFSFILNGGVAIIAGLGIITLFVLLQKMILHACVSEEGREKVINYIRTTLEVKRMGYIFETDASENIYDIYYQNKWRLGDIKESKWNVVEESKEYKLQLNCATCYECKKDFRKTFCCFHRRFDNCISSDKC